MKTTLYVTHILFLAQPYFLLCFSTLLLFSVFMAFHLLIVLKFSSNMAFNLNKTAKFVLIHECLHYGLYINCDKCN